MNLTAIKKKNQNNGSKDFANLVRITKQKLRLFSQSKVEIPLKAKIPKFIFH